MQYCNGGSLDGLIWIDGDPRRAKPSLPAGQIWRHLVDILLGLQHLHRQGILHRDLKPANILMHVPTSAERVADGGWPGGAFPRALLSDFGTAATLGEAESPSDAAVARGYTG